MSKQRANSFFIFPPIVEYREFYQQLLRGAVTHQQLGNRLIQLAEQANAFRQLDKVRDMAELLINSPIKEYQRVGQYYLALSVHQNGRGDMTAAWQILESVVGDLHSTYRAKAILLLAAVSARKRDYDSEFYYFTEALKVRPHIDTVITARRGIAVSKARAGFNDQALKELENLVPLLRYSRPLTYYDCLNSYAVELAEAGRKQEALSVSQAVLASPFAHAYPEWQATARDLKAPDHSFAAINVAPGTHDNVVPMPVIEHSIGQQISYGRPARVLSLQQWKKKMRKKLNGYERRDKSPQEMNESEMIYRIINLFTNPDTSEQKRIEMLEAVEKIASKPATPKPDDTGGA